MVRSSPAGAQRWCSFILIAMAFLAPVATGDQAARAQAPGSLLQVPDEVKQSTDVTKDKQQIQGVVDALTKQLAAESPADQAKARQALEAEAKVKGQPNASPAYLDVYTGMLDAALQNLVKDPNPRTRLNAAIVTANVAALAQASDHLKNAALALVNDQNDAVVLWGVKAAKSIIPVQMAVPGNADVTLVAAVVKAAQAHSKGVVAGPIVGEAYDALTLNIINNPAGFAKQPVTAIRTILPHLLDLMTARVQHYRRGVPPSPQSDAVGARFLCDPKVWPAMNAQQQLQAIQTLSDIIKLAGQQATAANAGDRVALAIAIQRIAASLSTIPKPPMTDAAMTALNSAARLAPGSSAQQITAAADAVLPAAVQGNEPAPAPASAPTTGPVQIPGAAAIPPTPPAPAAPAAPPGAGRPATPGSGTGTGTNGRTTPAPPPGPRPTPPPTPPARSTGGTGSGTR
jgi:hypothetical protein